jgi:RHS repeat-associated protein
MGSGIRRLTIAAAFLAMAAWTSSAQASPPSYLPSVTIGTASLISPSAAQGYYGPNTTHTVGLGAPTQTPPEIVELSRALKGNVDLIYEYMLNNIDVAWMYGLQKGALGADIDKSGTPFDQAVLMVALLRQANYTATYEVGTVTMTGAQFTAWTGISDATSACLMLSGGGIPAAINGSTIANCAYGTGTAISQVQLAHIWVKVNIPGSSCGANCLFDPSYKTYAWRSGLDFTVAAHFVPGRPFTYATSGMTQGSISGANYVAHLNESLLDSWLGTYASALLGYIKSQNLQGAQIEDIVGGPVLAQFVSPAGGVRQTALPYTTSLSVEWTGDIPDQYRTSLEVKAMQWKYTDLTHHTDTQMFDAKYFYLDEIYGRHLGITTDFYLGQTNITESTSTLFVDGVTIASYTNTPPVGFDGSMRGVPSHVILTLDHPYAASSGHYMDTVVDKPVVLITGLTIVDGIGDSRGLFDKWSNEMSSTDTPVPGLDDKYCKTNYGEFCVANYVATAGDFTRAKYAANLLEQYSRAARLNANIAKSIVQLHHELGVVYGDQWLNPVQTVNEPAEWSITDNYDRLDIDSGFSLASLTNDAPTRRVAVHALAAESATLEGSVAAQQSDLPDTASTTTRFAWANNPPSPDPEGPAQTPRNFFQFNSGNYGAAITIVTADNQTSVSPPETQWSGTQVVLGNGEIQDRRTALATEIGDYAGLGYIVVAPQDSFLGPGQRGGYFTSAGGFYSLFPTKQRGAALVATLYDGNGDPTNITHLIDAYNIVNGTLIAKGGGGGKQSDQQAMYDPNEGADILKSRFVDRSHLLGVSLTNGSLAADSPAMLTIGNGGFPYELTGSMQYHPAPLNILGYGPWSLTKPSVGWTSNWNSDLQMSGSGMEAMGRSDIRAAAGTIIAFLAAQDIYREPQSPQRDVAGLLATAYWAQQMSGNVVTVSLGGASRQLLRLADGTWIEPGSGYSTLTVTGSRTPYESAPAPICHPIYQLTRGWDYSGMSFKVTNTHGDVESFNYWSNVYQTDDGTAPKSCGQLKGFRLTSWAFPQGDTITLSYNAADAYPLPDGGNMDRLSTVSNNLGRTIRFNYTIGQDVPVSFTNNLTGPELRTVSLNYTTEMLTSSKDPMSALTQFTYNAPNSGSPAQRPLNYYELYQIFTADNTTKPNVQYGYDGLNRIEQVQDAVALQSGTGRAPYYFYIADGTRGERDDPLLQPYSVVYDGYGHPWRYIDEMGSETDAVFDSRGRPFQYAHPEQDCEAFAYDDHNNTTNFWKVDAASNCNTGAGSTHVLHSSAVYDQTWNKPTSVTNARGKTTILDYFGIAAGSCPTGNGTSLLCKATRPTITEGTPVYTFAYTSIGKVDTATAPFHASGPATTITTKNLYDSAGNLESTTVDPGTGELGLETDYGYDDIGDVTSTTDPRAIYTNSCYDLDRRKTEDDHHDGGSTKTLIAAEQTLYDTLGRDHIDHAATALASPVPCSGQTASSGITWLAIKTTTYTPTSKVYQVTDADGRTTTNTYDGDDRLYLVADPLSRKVRYLYCAPTDANCAANQIKIEYHAYQYGNACTKAGTLEQCYRRLTYSADGETHTVEDANNNITTYCYDDFVRLVETDFPDNTGVACQSATDYEKLTLDANGNVTQRQTRAGDLLTYQYNALDWITQKVSPRPALTTNWSYLLDGRIDTLSDTAGNNLAYGYDTAGRQNSVATTMAGFPGGVQTTQYALDEDGNRTQLKWPDGFYVEYCYDNLNRMTVAMRNSTDPNCNTTKFATYTYDALSRRKNVTYGFGSKMDYTYTPAGDLQTLNHTMVGSTPQYTFQYTNAHQLWTEAVSDPAGGLSYEWQPSAAATDSYAAPNKLNQYPSWTPSGGSSSGFGYDLNANLTSGTIGGAAWLFGYDAENRMLSACKPYVSGSTCTSPTVNATYAYDPLGRRTHKSGAGVTETWFLSDGTDEIFEYNSTGSPTRRIVPGPAIDEPIVQGSGTGLGTYRYFHTNHQGSVIGTVGSSGGLFEGPYTYDPYGNCYSGSSPCQLVNGGTSYRFTGRRFDAETGLLYYRARYYSPVIGRFLQTDPVGYSADMNLYTYVGNDPVGRIDPLGLYTYTCETGSRIGCAQGFETNQEKAAIKLQNAAERLGNAIKDVKAVAARQAAGDTSAAVSSETAQTEKSFSAVYGAQSDIAGAMSTVQTGLNEAVAGLQGTNPAANAAGDTLTTMQKGSAIIQTVPGSHQITMNPTGWNNITNEQRQWSLGHDALHAEATWHDYRGPNNELYYRWQRGGNSPLGVPSPANLTNPENAMCFVFGGC